MDQLIRPPKPGWLKRTLDAFRESPSLVVSTASLIVAVAALFLTCIAQARDAYYRELSIRPKLVVEHSTREFRFGLANPGLGPAEIRRVTFALDDKCYDASGMRREFSEFGRRLINYFFPSLASDLGVAIDAESEPAVTLRMSEPGSLIDKGEKFAIIRLLPAKARMLHEYISRLGQDKADKVHTAFHVAAIRAQLFVEYCSLSGAYCASYGKACTPTK